MTEANKPNIYHKSENGINLIKKSFSVMLGMKSVGIFALLILACNLTILWTFIEIEYQKFGVHLFDHKTFTTLMSLSFWTHMSHTLLILFTLCFANIITLFFRFFLSFLVTERLKGGKHPILLQILKVPFLKIRELLRIAVLRAIGFILTAGNLASFYSHIHKIRSLTAGDFKEEYDEYSKPEGMLLIPLIVEEDITTIQALAKSATLLESKFGKTMQIDFSFFGLKVLIITGSLILVGGPMHFLFGFHIFPTMATSITVIVSLASLIETAKILFTGAVYNYCKNEDTGPFSPQENLIPMFTHN